MCRYDCQGNDHSPMGLTPGMDEHLFHLQRDQWQAILVRRTSCWPTRLPQEVVELRPPSKATFIRLRKQGQSKHLGWVEGCLEAHLPTPMDNGTYSVKPGGSVQATLPQSEMLNERRSLQRTRQDRWNQWNYHRWILWHNRRNNDPYMALRMSSWIQWGLSNHQSYVGRGVGSPIPSVQEGAWIRDSPKVVDGGLLSSTWNHEWTWLSHTPYPAGWCCPC